MIQTLHTIQNRSEATASKFGDLVDQVDISRLAPVLNWVRSWLWCCCGLLLFFSGCKTTKLQPVAIEREDMCSYCKMAISEKKYAAEFIDSEEKVFKFDDMGCMLNFVKSKKISNVAAYFVMDFDEGQWLKADDAYFVRSSEVDTPMGGGFIAFRDQTKAQQAVEKFKGKLFRFNEVVNQF